MATGRARKAPVCAMATGQGRRASMISTIIRPSCLTPTPHGPRRSATAALSGKREQSECMSNCSRCMPCITVWYVHLPDPTQLRSVCLLLCGKELYVGLSLSLLLSLSPPLSLSLSLFPFPHAGREALIDMFPRAGRGQHLVGGCPASRPRGQHAYPIRRAHSCIY